MMYWKFIWLAVVMALVPPEGHRAAMPPLPPGMVEFIGPSQVTDLPMVRVQAAGQIEMLRLVQVDDSTLKLLAIAPYGAGWRLESSSNLVQWFDLGELETVACLELTTNEMVMSQQTIAASWPAGNWTNQSDRTGYSWSAGGWTNGPTPRVWFRLVIP